jgi:hypothetical protein
MGLRERVFIMEFWWSGICMTRGTTTDVAAAGGAAIRLAHRRSCPGTQHRLAVRAVRRPSRGPRTRRGCGVHVEKQYNENPRQARHLDRLHTFLALAIHEPRLRLLLPFTIPCQVPACCVDGTVR